MSKHLESRLKGLSIILADRNIYVNIDNSYYKMDYETFIRDVEESEEYESLLKNFNTELKELIEKKGGVLKNRPRECEWISGCGLMLIYGKLKTTKEVFNSA